MRGRLGLLLLMVAGLACGPSQSNILGLGDPCTPGSASTVCGTGLCVALDSATGFCTQTCENNCPTDFTCEAAGRYGRICRKLTGCKSEVDCPAGHICDADTGRCYIKATRSICAPCQDSAQCAPGGSCFKAVGSGEQFCTEPCGAADACPNGFSCQAVPAGKDGAVLKQCVPTSQTCNAGKGLCAACRGDDECGGPWDLCVRNVVSQETFCGKDCNPAKNVCPSLGCAPASLDSAQNPDCPTGFSCTNLKLSTDPAAGGPYQCVPNSNSCKGYCNATDDIGQVSQCGLGRVCTDGNCLAAADGRMCSPCTDTDDCRRGGFAENRCIVNNCPDCPFKGEAFCSTPCADDAACFRSFGVGFVCKPVDDPSGAVKKYCMPQRGSCQAGLKHLGEDCSTNGARDCITGTCLVAGLTSFCSQPCTADTQCGDTRYRCCEVSPAGGYDCSAPQRTATGPKSGSGVCAPLGGLFGDDCTPGRAPCQSGTCLDVGTARVCTVTCASGACPDGYACRKASQASTSGTVDICFPNGGGKAGASCAFGPAACESGLCIRKDSGPVCTMGCQTNTDCPTEWTCELLKSVTDQSVQACLPPYLVAP